MEEPKGQPNQEPKEAKVKIKVQGEEKEVTQAELIELAQKGDDYTAKTQKLAEDRKTMESETQKKAEEMAEQYLTQLAEEQKPEPKPEDSNLTDEQKRIANLEAKLAKMEGSTEETKVAQYELQYEKQLADCKTKYPNMDEKVVLATLSANPNLSMEDLAKESHTSKEKERDEWIKEYVEGKKTQPKESGGGPSTVPLTPAKEMTRKDLMDGTVKRAATDAIRKSTEE